jgi:hypothetical protein
MKERGILRTIWSWFLLSECFFWIYLQKVIPNRRIKSICLIRAVKVGRAAADVRG